jgi:hypothetical protein
MILQIGAGGVVVSARSDPILGWRPTVVAVPRHMRNAQELAEKIATELHKKFQVDDLTFEHSGISPTRRTRRHSFRPRTPSKKARSFPSPYEPLLLSP